jgi:RNA polymerase sigma-70 factor (ECF subfamily)
MHATRLAPPPVRKPRPTAAAQPFVTAQPSNAAQPSAGELLAEQLSSADASVRDAAFDEMVRLHAAYVRQLVARLLGYAVEADDVVQDVFVAAYQALPRFRGDASVTTWLTTIAVNRCRTLARRRRLRLDWLRKLAAGAARPTERSLASQDPECDETAQRVRAAVGKLPQKYREVIVLRYLEELPVAEVAQVLRISRGAVDVRLTRARAKLAPLLRELTD